MSNENVQNDRADELDVKRHHAAEASANAGEAPPEADFHDAVDREPAAATYPPSNDERVLEAERQVLRAHAELENFRKRMQRDSDQQLKYANLPLLRDLLEVVDNINRALEAARSDADNPEALLAGVEMIREQLLGVLAKFGCKPVQAVGSEFDPNIHEAIAQMASGEHAAGAVAQEVAVGYLLHDRVIRPSSVIVSTGPAAT